MSDSNDNTGQIKKNYHGANSSGWGCLSDPRRSMPGRTSKTGWKAGSMERMIRPFLIFVFLVLAGCTTKSQSSTATSALEQLKDNRPRAYAESIIANFDLDLDSTVSCDEFLLATIQIFNSMDTNQDLKLSQQELGPLSTKATDAADVNGDRMLSFSEVLRDLDAQCRNYDIDNNGHLSIEELELFAKSRTAEEGR